MIIPTFNEEMNIEKIIKEVKKLRLRFNLELIVADGGSTDKTLQKARKLGARIISLPYKSGKGLGVKKGFSEAKGDYIVQIDADYQFDPKEIPVFVKKLAIYDIVVGSRFKGRRGRNTMNKLNFLGNRFLSAITSLFAGVRVSDVMAGFKGIRKEAAAKLNISANHFGYEAEIIIKGGRLGFSICEVPVSYRRRIHGESNVKLIPDGFRVLTTIIKSYFETFGK